MDALLIRYVDSSGNITERQITDIKATTETAITAYCHLRSMVRSFKIENIVHAVIPHTGEIINPWQLIENDDKPKSIHYVTWEVMPAIKAVKFFAYTTRGIRKRELKHLVDFVSVITDVSQFREIQVEQFIKKLWCGDTKAYMSGETIDYLALLKSIPEELIEVCKKFAVLIAQGSGRKKINSHWEERINSEFSPNPVAIKWIDTNGYNDINASKITIKYE